MTKAPLRRSKPGVAILRERLDPLFHHAIGRSRILEPLLKQRRQQFVGLATFRQRFPFGIDLPLFQIEAHETAGQGGRFLEIPQPSMGLGSQQIEVRCFPICGEINHLLLHSARDHVGQSLRRFADMCRERRVASGEIFSQQLHMVESILKRAIFQEKLRQLQPPAGVAGIAVHGLLHPRGRPSQITPAGGRCLGPRQEEVAPFRRRFPILGMKGKIPLVEFDGFGCLAFRHAFPRQPGKTVDVPPHLNPVNHEHANRADHQQTRDDRQKLDVDSLLHEPLSATGRMCLADLTSVGAASFFEWNSNWLVDKPSIHSPRRRHSNSPWQKSSLTL